MSTEHDIWTFFLQHLVRAITTTTKPGTFHQKNSKINPLVVKPVLECNCKPFNKNATTGSLSLKPDPQTKKNGCPIINTILPPTQWIKKSVSIFVFYVWTTIEHQVRNLYASRKVQVFFPVFASQKHFSGNSRATIKKCSNWPQ